jgi:hypothetical protein
LADRPWGQPCGIEPLSTRSVFYKTLRSQDGASLGRPRAQASEKGQSGSGRLQTGRERPIRKQGLLPGRVSNSHGKTEQPAPPAAAAERPAGVRGRRAPPELQPRRRRAFGDAGRRQPADPEPRGLCRRGPVQAHAQGPAADRRGPDRPARPARSLRPPGRGRQPADRRRRRPPPDPDRRPLLRRQVAGAAPGQVRAGPPAGRCLAVGRHGGGGFRGRRGRHRHPLRGSGRYPGLEVIRLLSETVVPVVSPALLAENASERARRPGEPHPAARRLARRRRQLPRLGDVAGGARHARIDGRAARASTSPAW